jgi:hypothetical protein
MRSFQVLCFVAAISCAQPQLQSPAAKRFDATAEKNKGQTPAKAGSPATLAEATQKAHTNKAADTDKQETDRQTNDQRLADYTGKLAEYTKALAAFTAVLVGVGILQFAALFWQARILGHHSRSLRQSVIQMRRSVRAYRRDVELGESTLELTQESNKITRDATELTRQSFIAAHRPRLTIRFVTTLSEIGEAGEGISGNFLVYNTGGTTATLQHCYSEVVFGDSLPQRSKQYAEGGGDSLGAIVLRPGQSAFVNFPTGGPRKLETDERIAIRKRQEAVRANAISGKGQLWHNLFLIGWIGYTDESRKGRRAGFCRQYDFTEKRFVIDADHDYEYED